MMIYWRLKRLINKPKRLTSAEDQEWQDWLLKKRNHNNIKTKTMKDKFDRLDSIISDLWILAYIFGGNLNDEDMYGNSTVEYNINTYKSSIIKLEELFDDIVREYGDVKLRELNFSRPFPF